MEGGEVNSPLHKRRRSERGQSRACKMSRQGYRRYVFTRDLASGWRGVQSFGGKATCQKVGLGSRNSTPTFICSPGNLSMCTTTHSSAPFVWIFDRVSRCPRERGAGMNREAHGDFHQDPLTPAAVGREPGGFAGLGNPGIQNPTVFRLNGSKHEAHALARLVVDDPCLSF